MWRWLDRLAEETALEPKFVANRCLRERQAVGGCSACAEVCPHEAITLGPLGNAVSIDPERCTGCGLCVQACPTGALEIDTAALLGSVRAQGEAARLSCSQAEGGRGEVQCLGRVTPAVMAAAGAWQKPLTLVHGACASCSLGAACVPEVVQAASEEAAALRGTAPFVSFSDGGAEAEEVTSRRNALGGLFSAARREALSLFPEDPLSQNVPERLPSEWHWRRRAIQNLPPEAIVHWPAPLVDDGCIDCPVCSNVCPTEAIVRQREEERMRLVLSLEACTGCMACVRSCPPQAMRPNERWRRSAFDGPLEIFRKS